MIDGRPSGTVTKRRITSPCWSVSRIVDGLEPAGSRNSPALIGSPLPSSLAQSRKLSAEPISSSASSFSATDVSDEPDGTTKAVSSSTSDEPHQPQVEAAAIPASSAASTIATIQPLRPMGLVSGNLLQDQAGVGAAEAEAVVEHRADRARLGLVRHQVDAFATL